MRWCCTAANDLNVVTSCKGNREGGVRCLSSAVNNFSTTSDLHGSVNISLELTASTYLMSTIACILARAVVRKAIRLVAATE